MELLIFWMLSIIVSNGINIYIDKKVERFNKKYGFAFKDGNNKTFKFIVNLIIGINVAVALTDKSSKNLSMEVALLDMEKSKTNNIVNDKKNEINSDLKFQKSRDKDLKNQPINMTVVSNNFEINFIYEKEDLFITSSNGIVANLTMDEQYNILDEIILTFLTEIEKRYGNMQQMLECFGKIEKISFENDDIKFGKSRIIIGNNSIIKYEDRIIFEVNDYEIKNKNIEKLKVMS